MQNKKAGKPSNKPTADTAPKLRGKNGFNYTPKWAVIIPCDSEATQQQIYEHLHSIGYKCRVVNV